MKRAFLTLLTGFAAGMALRPVIERHGPGWVTRRKSRWSPKRQPSHLLTP
jgi:hypothetical protein